MKSTESKTTVSSCLLQAQKASQPFFQKGRKRSFFSKETPQADFFFSPKNIQPKLTIGQPGDQYEQEADAMAEKVVRRDQLAGGRSAVGSGPKIQLKCAECEQEERLQKKEGEEEETILPKIQKKPNDNLLQRLPIGGPALAATPAATSSPLPAAIVQQWQAEVTAGNLLQAVNVIVQEMISRGEIDTSIFQIQQAASGASTCITPNPQLIVLDSTVNGANTQTCTCIISGTNKYANPRISIHPDLVQFTNVGSTTPQANAVTLHSTLLHEFRHVRQLYEACNTPGTVISSGICTDCNNPEEMDAYLSEVEAGYNQWEIMHAWIRVYVNWNYLSANQQGVFQTRKMAAEQKVNQLFPGVPWANNHRVQAYERWCLSLPNAGAPGACNSFMTPAPAPSRMISPGAGGHKPELGDFPLPGPESNRMA